MLPGVILDFNGDIRRWGSQTGCPVRTSRGESDWTSTAAALLGEEYAGSHSGERLQNGPDSSTGVARSIDKSKGMVKESGVFPGRQTSSTSNLCSDC